VRPLAVVGNLSYDLVDGGPPRPGGGPLHCARALRLLHRRATILGRCAPVDEPVFRRAFARLGLPVTILPGTQTTTFSFTYDGDRRQMRVERAGDVWTGADVAAVPRGTWVHAAPLLHGDFPPATVAALARGRRLSIDGQGLTRARHVGDLELRPEADVESLRHVSVLKLAEEEAEALVGGLDPAALAQLGPPEVVVTFGSRGCLVVVDGVSERIRAHHVDADPTGSGDAFAAAYVAARASGHAPVPAARRATAVVGAMLSALAR
jgi:sugar/nucleoside kinase (ribokinase family)